MRIAFKEWAIVIDALGRGEQMVILRKGGISEGRGGFKPEHEEFLLFPTLFHQQRDCVVPSAQFRYDQIAPHLPPKETLRLEYFARVAACERLESTVQLENLRGQHIYRDEVLQERFEWSRNKHLYCLFVRVYKLAHCVELPMLPEYGGCKSWVTLSQEIAATGAEAILDEDQFISRVRHLEEALHLYRSA